MTERRMAKADQGGGLSLLTESPAGAGSVLSEEERSSNSWARNRKTSVKGGKDEKNF
jgi:hypothetical protein